METILLIEDDVALRAQVRFALEERFEVKEAANVQKAVHILNSERITLAILDLGLPPHENTPQEGLRLLHYILENFGLKVIIFTGQKTESAALESIKSGAFDYLVKPVSIEQLMFSVDRAILFRDIEEELSRQGTARISFGVEVGKGLQPARDEAEKNIIFKVLKDTNFNVYKSAKLLGVKRESLYYFIKKFGFKREDIDDNP